MPATQAVLGPDRATRALAMLFLGSFVLGGSELLVVGMLNVIGADLRVSVPAAGALATAYAPSPGVGEPIDRADGWNLVAGVLLLHRPRLVPLFAPDITAVRIESRFRPVGLPVDSDSPRGRHEDRLVLRCSVAWPEVRSRHGRV